MSGNFHKLLQGVYENKLKTAYGHVISCFHKLSLAILQLRTSIDKFK